MLTRIVYSAVKTLIIAIHAIYANIIKATDEKG